MSLIQERINLSLFKFIILIFGADNEYIKLDYQIDSNYG